MLEIHIEDNLRKMLLERLRGSAYHFVNTPDEH
jgi:hypothetical protein